MIIDFHEKNFWRAIFHSTLFAQILHKYSNWSSEDELEKKKNEKSKLGKKELF